MRSNLQIAIGKYTGDGTADRYITGVGFRPQFVMVKGGTNIASFRTDKMANGYGGLFAGSGVLATNIIQQMMIDGFQVGTASNANASGTTYYYVAIRGVSAQSYFRTGKYRGNATDNRDFTTGGLAFTPDMVYTKIDGGTVPCFRTSAMSGDTSAFMSATLSAANNIQSLISNGFQLGTASESNGNFDYYFFALKALAGVFAVGSYAGNGASNSITGVGFKPDMVIVKNSATSDAARLLTKDMVTDTVNSVFMTSTASNATGILTLDTDGFSVGSHASVNGNGNTVQWIALKSGNFNAPLTRSLTS